MKIKKKQRIIKIYALVCLLTLFLAIRNGKKLESSINNIVSAQSLNFERGSYKADKNDFDNSYSFYDTKKYSNLSSAIKAIGREKATLMVSNEQVVNANQTIPDNVTLKFERGGRLYITSGTLKIYGTIEAGIYRIFRYDKTISTTPVLFCNNSPGIVYPQWWGAGENNSVHNSVNADDTSAMQAAINSLNNGGTVLIPKGNYKISDTLRLKNSVSLIGPELRNGNDVYINYYGRSSAIQCYLPAGRYVGGFSDIVISGVTLIDVNNTGLIGFDLKGFRRCELRNTRIIGFDRSLYLKQSCYAKITDVSVSKSREYGVYLDDQCNNTLFTNLKIAATTQACKNDVNILTSSNVNFVNLLMEGDIKGLNIYRSNAVLINGLYAEHIGSIRDYVINSFRSNGTVVIAPYINGNNKIKFGVTSDKESSTTILGGRISNCIHPYLDIKAISTINVSGATS